MPGLESKGAPALEGNYSTWTHKWTKEFPDGLLGYNYAAFYINEDKGIFAITWRDAASSDRYGVYKLADMSVVFQSPAGAHYLYSRPELSYHRWITIGETGDFSGGGYAASRTRYLAIVRNDGRTLEIWKDGVLKQTIVITDYIAGAYCELGHFSLTGKYLILTTLPYLLLFEGS